MKRLLHLSSEILGQRSLYKYETIYTNSVIVLLLLSSIVQAGIESAVYPGSDTSFIYQNPVMFIPNKGQVPNSEMNGTDYTVLFTANMQGVNVFFKADGLYYSWFEQAQSKSGNMINSIDASSAVLKKFGTAMIFENANANCVIEASEPIAYYESYYLPHICGHLDQVPSYSKIIYHDLYPKIDLVFHGGSEVNRMKYEFIVHPGGDPSIIALRHEGGEISLNEDGGMIVYNPLGKIVEEFPMTYQENYGLRTPVSSSFSKLSTNLISFTIGDYDKSKTLVIDPWGTFFGGGSSDPFHSIESNEDGVFCGGVTNSLSGVASIGAYDETMDGLYDMMIVKFSKKGIRKWATYFGGSGYDLLYQLVVSAGKIYVAGSTQSDGLATAGAYDNTRIGNEAIFARFSSTGFLQQCSYYGGSGQDFGYGIQRGSDGNVYVFGVTDSPTEIAKGNGGSSTTLSGGYDFFLARFNGNLHSVNFGRYYGGEANEYSNGNAFEIDAENKTYLTGSTSSETGIFGLAPGYPVLLYYPEFQGETDAVIACFNQAELQWGAYYGGLEFDEGVSLDIENDSLYFSGNTLSYSGIATIGSYDESKAGATDINDAMVGKFLSNGTRVWVSYYGGDETEHGYSVIWGNGNVYLGGRTYSYDNISSAGCYQPDFAGGEYDGFFVEFNGIGTERVFGTYLGGADEDFVQDMDFDEVTKMYLCGSSNSLTLPFVSTGAFLSVNPGGDNTGFITRFSLTGNYSPKIATQVVNAPGYNNTCHFDLFPNPALNIIAIRINGDGATPRSVEILNILGQKIKSFSFSGTEEFKSYELDISDLKSGIYLLSAKSDSFEEVRRFIKN